MPGLGGLELFFLCLIGLAGFAIPIALLVIVVFLYQRVTRIEERLDQLDMSDSP